MKSGKKYQEDSNMVWEAAEHGDIPVDRFCSYRKLMNENRYLENSQAYLAEKKQKFKNISKKNKRNRKDGLFTDLCVKIEKRY